MSHKMSTAFGQINAHIALPGSESITNRALFLASLAEGVSEVSGIKINKYTKDFINALHQAGIAIQLDEKSASCIIAGCNGNLPKKQTTIWLGPSKAALRSLLAACASSSGVYYFDGKDHLGKFLMTDLLAILCREGAQTIPSETKQLPFTLIGADTLEGGDIILNGSTTPQQVSALLMISPYARSAINFTLPDSLDMHYIDMTSTLMAEFGVLVHHVLQGQLAVPVPQRYQARDYTIEPDFSLASYFWAAAAVTGGELTIQPIKRALSKQNESQFLTVLEKMGCRIFETHKGLTVKGPAALQGTEITYKDNMINSFYSLMAIAPFANSPTRISFLDGHSIKQKNFISATKNLLEKIHVRVETEDHSLTIYPSVPRGNLIDLEDNPRLTMAAAIIGLKIPIVIPNKKCVTKMYPEFFTLWNQLAEKACVSV
jgi:3-phosphoshikimate 1-carboxyvinyltransferase